MVDRATSQFTASVESGERFTFGENWTRFIRLLDEERIAAACDSLGQMLQVRDLRGKRFLDIGSGSGLFSLAARRLGATVHSFDYDPQSVACTRELRRRYFPDDADWTVDEASALDPNYLRGLGQFDVVYSWGVLHHTGSMYPALGYAAERVADSGTLFIAIYNDQGWISRYWLAVKRRYNQSALFRGLLILFHMPYLYGARYAVRLLTGRAKLERGMSLWTDMIDWLGGYPFEVATPEGVFDFYRERGFELVRLKTCRGRMGCNEFVFRRHARI
jgi:2-polyprenyl-3-methyl-5-hydroxy-6-metoxy-1,4-benzoquinol methylase